MAAAATRKDACLVRFLQLTAYIDVHGHSRVPTRSEDKEEQALGQWTRRQGHSYKKGILNKERVDKLNSIEFQWCIRQWTRVPERHHDVYDAKWNKMLEDCKETKARGERFSSKQKQWIQHQSWKIRENKMNKERHEMITSACLFLCDH